MATLRLALAQVDPTVGDLTGNAALVRAWAAKAAGAGAHVVAFPEMMLTGYPVEDLVFRDSFVAASQAGLGRLAAQLADDGLGGMVVLVGYLDADGPARISSDAAPNRGPRNALGVLFGGQVVARYFKHHLPNYGVFDEVRYFVPGDRLTVIRLGEVDIALTICEDMWQAGGPFTAARRANVDLVININGSPYDLAKDDARLALARRRAAEADATLAYVNMVGGQDELVFDGDSMVVTAAGDLLARAGQFTEELLTLDLDLDPAKKTTPVTAAKPPAVEGEPETGIGATMPVDVVAVTDRLTTLTGPRCYASVAPRRSDEAEVWQALVLALRDYARKNGFKSAILAISGGIDSAIVAAIAVDALGASQVHGVSMPSEFSSEHSKVDAIELARRTGLHYSCHPIAPMVDAFLTNVALSGLAVENLQARVRGVLLMAISNQDNHLVLTTGNKSELAVGYSTLYGDSVGGFNPIKDVPKTLVWRLAKWRNTEALERSQTPPIPENSIAKPPSAELRPGQLDTDSLPDYSELDPLLAAYIDSDIGRDELIAGGHDPATVDRVLRMVDLAEYKRRQAAPGPKISIKAFGRDRRLPITSRFRG